MASATSVSEIGAAIYLPPERAHFKELLLTNHFKSLPEPPPGEPPVGNTSYEELVCVGYQPQLKQLNAVVHLKLSDGYSGGICTAGSQEYVKFFASTDDGSTWSELGLTSFTAWDVDGVKPLEFDVTLPVDLAAKCCKSENIVLIRAILSWAVPPGGPDAPIVWGNGLDVHVQVAPFKLGTFENLFECLEIKVPEQLAELVDVEQVIEFGANTELSALQLHELYKDTEVPQHRYLLGEVAQLLADPVALGAAASEPEFELFSNLKGGVDLGKIVGILSDPQGNETYEQLGCVGLNTDTNALAATIDVKLSSGYSGGLCTAGSYEYVAFWADWGSGYEYVGTTSVNVHDIASIPAGGLRYAATLPFAQALTGRKPCGEGANEVAVRAVLSWATPPSSTDPYATPVWGGHLETHVLIPPGEALAGGPDLESIGSMPLSRIDKTTGLASGQSLLTWVASDCPFGGVVEFTGHVIDASGGVGGPSLQYRILVSTNGGSSYTPMTAPFGIETHNWSTGVFTPVTQTPDPTEGWCTCREDYSASIDVVGNILGSWPTAGDGQLWVAMEVRQGTVPLGPASPTWTLIQLDNTAPSPVEVEITSGGGSCGDFSPGDTIKGSYYAADNEDLGSVTIEVEMPMPEVTPKQTTTSKTLTSEAGTWKLKTLPTTKPCGYTITAIAVDNTIVDSAYIGWRAYGYTGLCLRS